MLLGVPLRVVLISTHTLRKEGDFWMIEQRIIKREISTHTLRKEGDDKLGYVGANTIEFQPTPSARRVTSRRRG